MEGVRLSFQKIFVLGLALLIIVLHAREKHNFSVLAFYPFYMSRIYVSYCPFQIDGFSY